MRACAWTSLAAGVIGAGLLAAAVQAGPAQKSGGTLRLGVVQDVDSVDPALAYTTLAWSVEFATCAKLYSYPDKPAPDGAVIVPEVAKSFPSVSRNGRTYTIELRRTYRFHTGQRITAANYVAAFNRDANPKLESPALSNYLGEIAGVDALSAGKTRTVSGVRALGPYTLQIRTTRPLPDLVARLTVPFFCPVAANTPPAEIEDPLGSGPYYIAARVPNRQLVLERNRFYRGPRRAHVDRVVLTVVSGPEACWQAVERDELDRCGMIPEPAARELAARYGINKRRLFFNPGLNTFFFAFNHNRPAFRGRGQIPLKQAINWAIDRSALVRARGFLQAKRTDQILPPAMGQKAKIYPLVVTDESLARARTLLDRASYKPDRLVLYTSSSAFGAAAADIFRVSLTPLGIDVEIKYFDTATLVQKENTRGEPFDVGFGAWAADYADPSSFFATLSGDKARNIGWFGRRRYDREIKRIEGLSGKARRRAWAALDVQMMRDDPPWAPYLNLTAVDFVSKSFGCYVFQPVIGQLDIVAACKK